MKIKQLIKRFLVIGSILIGVTPLLMSFNFFKKKKAESSPSISPLQLTGVWMTKDEAFSLEVYPDPSLSINGTKLNLKLHSMQEDELYLTDQYGYIITVKKTGAESLEVFDEAEDKKYSFYKTND